jgi:hypothetical protein
MKQIIDERVALALSKQSSHQQGPTDEMSPSAKRKSSTASTKHAPTSIEGVAPIVEAANPGLPEKRPHWPVDDITVRSVCELPEFAEIRSL